jgi:hypothetical protein
MCSHDSRKANYREDGNIKETKQNKNPYTQTYRKRREAAEHSRQQTACQLWKRNRSVIKQMEIY